VNKGFYYPATPSELFISGICWYQWLSSYKGGTKFPVTIYKE